MIIRNKKFKAALISVLFAALIFACVSPLSVLFASAETADNTDLTVSIEECVPVAQKWLEINYSDDTEISEIIPVMAGETVSYYCVNFKNSAGPNGYVMFDAYRYTDELVSEFALSGKSVYDVLYENAGLTQTTRSLSSKPEKVIYSLGAYNYAIPENGYNSKFYTSYGESINKAELNSIGEEVKELKESALLSKSVTPYAGYDDAVYWGSQLVGVDDSCEIYSITGSATFIPSTANELLNANNSNNSVPAAGANILSFYKEKRGCTNLGTSRQNIYNKILEKSSWDKNGSSVMTNSQLKDAMKKVAKAAGYSLAIDTYTYDNWSSWKRDLRADHTVYTVFYGYAAESIYNKKMSQAVVAVGYREYNTGYKYLRVYDGWNNSNDRYLLFNSDVITDLDGARINVK